MLLPRTRAFDGRVFHLRSKDCIASVSVDPDGPRETSNDREDRFR